MKNVLRFLLGFLIIPTFVFILFVLSHFPGVLDLLVLILAFLGCTIVGLVTSGWLK